MQVNSIGKICGVMLWIPIESMCDTHKVDVCVHISLTLWVSTSYIVFMTMNALEPMTQFVTSLLSLCKMLVSTWDEIITYVFFKHIQLLSLMNWHCAYQRWHHTLVNVVIVDPMQVDLLLWSCATQGFVTSDGTQAKEKSYHNQHPINQFLPLAIEVFDYLHKHANVFLHDCANAIWKG